MARPLWTVVGIGGESRLHVAAVLRGNAVPLIASDPGPSEWVHVTRARTPEDAAQWARETYLDHLAGRLDAQVSVTVAGRPERASRWRRRTQ